MTETAPPPLPFPQTIAKNITRPSDLRSRVKTRTESGVALVSEVRVRSLEERKAEQEWTGNCSGLRHNTGAAH